MKKTTVNDKDSIWKQIRFEAKKAVEEDHIVAPLLRQYVLDKTCIEEALAIRLIDGLQTKILDKDMLMHSFTENLKAINATDQCIEADLYAVYERDPATHRLMDALIYYKGFHALQIHRIAHNLWNANRQDFAYYLQSCSSTSFQIDIHPRAKIGKGVFIDHATGLVIGETVKIDDDVSLLHEVTLGGTGKEDGDRHPKISRGVLVGAGAKVLGNITIGAYSQIAANSVVLKNVPAHVTAAGVPAKIIGEVKVKNPASNMDQTFIYGDGDGI